jgi:hypothetical protein
VSVGERALCRGIAELADTEADPQAVEPDWKKHPFVMAGLVPAIHVFSWWTVRRGCPGQARA